MNVNLTNIHGSIFVITLYESNSLVAQMVRLVDGEKWIIAGLCVFLGYLSFKPSEPYLSEYLICNKSTQEEYCAGYTSLADCSDNAPCLWDSSGSCGVTSCNAVSSSNCGDDDYDYCTTGSNDSCEETTCYKNYTEDQVNNEIYPWSTYAYLPWLLTLGFFAEYYSYRVTILFGILGRVVTRFLLLYGNNIIDMQLMQVVYALGTAAEDVLTAYIYYVLSPVNFQLGTSYIRATHLAVNLVSGVLGDLLVVEGDTSVRVLMWISAISVCNGFIVGIYALRTPTHRHRQTQSLYQQPTHSTQGAEVNPLLLDGSSVHSEASDSSTNSPQRGLVDLEIIANSYNNSNTCTSSNPIRSNSNPPGSSDGGSRDDRTSKKRPSSASTGIDGVEGESSTVLQLIQTQGGYLMKAMRTTPLLALVAYWAVGNAVFMTLYDYEVAIYEEVNGGSNDWNGSILGVMLLAGTAGAMLPTWLRHDQLPLTTTPSTPTSTISTTTAEKLAEIDREQGIRTSASSSSSSSAPPSPSASSSSVPMTSFTPTLEATTNVPTTTTTNTTNANTNTNTNSAAAAAAAADLTAESDQDQDKSYLGTIAPEFTVSIRILLMGLLSSALLLLFVLSWQVVASVSFLALFFFTWQYINVVTFARLALALKLAQSSSNDAKTSNKQTQATSERNATSRSGDEEMMVRTNNSSSRVECHAVVAPKPGIASGGGSGGVDDDKQLDRTHLEATAMEVDPPYSVAIVTVIAVNVLVQIILQAITFSGLMLPLRTSCWVFVCVFVAATSTYLLFLLFWFGSHDVHIGVKKLFDWT